MTDDFISLLLFGVFNDDDDCDPEDVSEDSNSGDSYKHIVRYV